jgi:hypothetical protein
MSVITVPKLKKKNTLQSFTDENVCIAAIVADTTSIPNYNNLRVDYELIRRICCLIENMIKNNKNNSPKINKKEMCIKIFKLVFPGINPDEVNTIEKQIEYLWNNNKIKAIPLVNKIAKGLFKWEKKIGLIMRNFISNYIQDKLRISMPSTTQIIAASLLAKMGFEYSIILIILMLL